MTPRTALRMSHGIGRSAPPVLPPDRGLQADVPVRPTIADVRDQRDVVMEAVRELSLRA